MPNAPLLVIYTGGTLGMVASDNGLVPGRDFETRLRSALATLPPASQVSLPEFELLEYPDPIDSSAATPADWQRLARDIAEHHVSPQERRSGAQKCYAGFIVLHGTDTLAWTASSLAYQLQGIDCPVVVSGAQMPLEANGSDALTNIEAALRFAAQPALQEVAVCFGNKLMRGVRTRKWDTHAFDGFDSPNHPLLGEMIGGAPVLYPTHGLDNQAGQTRFELPDYVVAASAATETPVVRITLWPGISARLLSAWLLDDSVQGALLEVWGSGNIPEDPAILDVLAQATAEGRILAAISQCPHGPVSIGTYAAGQGLLNAGVLSGGDMTPEAVMCKLTHLLALPLDMAERHRRFLTSLAGERQV